MVTHQSHQSHQSVCFPFLVSQLLYKWPQHDISATKPTASAMSYIPQPAQDGYGMNYPITAIPSTENVPMILPRAVESGTDDVSRRLLAVFAPELSPLPGRVVRRELFTSSRRFLDGLSAVQVPQTVQRNQLPVTFSIPVGRDPRASGPPPIYPSHVLAVSPPPASSRPTPIDAPVALVTVHGAVIGANCTNVDLPAPVPQSSDPRFLNLAAYRLTVYSLPAFVILRLYMYGRRIDTFMDSILPFPPTFLQQFRPNHRTPGHESLRLTGTANSAPQTRSLAEHLIISTPGGAYPMWERIRLLQGVWQTMCELGMYEPLLWQALDLAWQVARYALVVVSEQHGQALAAEAANNQGRRS
ncbi:hypothetical protein B0H14DRAFT_2819228 [Mycena olivaceomarginata]|nr:hypothetical protein B0H14DRAFT_2819228 [Mycena olivaceomarginata]